MTRDIAAEGRALQEAAKHPADVMPDYRDAHARYMAWLRNNADTILSALERLDRMAEVVAQFFAKWDECAPHVNDAFFHRQLRMGEYIGPQFGEELAALRHLEAAIRSLNTQPNKEAEG